MLLCLQMNQIYTFNLKPKKQVLVSNTHVHLLHARHCSKFFASTNSFIAHGIIQGKKHYAVLLWGWGRVGPSSERHAQVRLLATRVFYGVGWSACPATGAVLESRHVSLVERNKSEKWGLLPPGIGWQLCHLGALCHWVTQGDQSLI